MGKKKKTLKTYQKGSVHNKVTVWILLSKIHNTQSLPCNYNKYLRQSRSKVKEQQEVSVDRNHDNFTHRQMIQGYNREKNESNVWPAMLFHGNIKAHVYKSANETNIWRQLQRFPVYRNLITWYMIKTIESTLTQMSLLVMISSGKRQMQIVENFLTNLKTCNASWPSKKHWYFHNADSKKIVIKY